MNLEIIEYFKQLAKREFFFINLANSILGLAIIVLGFVALSEGVTPQTYAIMFGAGAIMFFLNFCKGVKKNGKNRWIFLACAIVFALISGVFVVSIMM